MSRIIKTDTAGKQRGQLAKAVVLAVRRLAGQSEFGDEARDLASFISLALGSIHEGIDVSVAAWEKRGYWIKADRFRMEWDWTDSASTRMKSAIMEEDWAAVAALSVETAQRLKAIKVSDKARVGTPWQGAFARLRNG